MSKIKKILNIIFDNEKIEKKKKTNIKSKPITHTPKNNYSKKVTTNFSKIKSNNHDEYINVTELSKHFQITPAQLNNIFQKLNWSIKEQRWIIATKAGIKNGAKECYDSRNKVKYLRWNKSTKNDVQLIRAVNEFKTIKPKSNKEKGEEYEQFIAKYYTEKGYTVWEHGKEKGRLDQGIDLIVKKNKEIIFIQCKNWQENTRFKIDHVRIKASRAEARQFMLNNPLFKGYENKFRYTISNDCMHPSAVKYIEETNGLFDYEIISYP